MKCITSELRVPAEAEIVIEGRLLPLVREMEGPFGEFPQYYGEPAKRHVIEITALTHRKDAIFHTIVGGGLEHLLLGGIPREATLLAHLQRSFPNVRDVHLARGGVCRYHLYVQAAKRQEGEAKNIIMGAFAGHYDIKQVIVVDEDVDIHNPVEVEWAVATRFQADKDLLVVTNSQGSKLDPSTRDGVGAKMGLDATKPLDAKEMKFKRIRVPGEEDVDPDKVVDLTSGDRPGGSRSDLWTKREGRNHHGVSEYLRPGSFIDSDAENVVSFARAAAGDVSDERERIIRVYHAVRDDILYDPYVDYTDPTFYRASSILEHRRGYCVSKASLLAAAARAVGTPARVGYADVKNHMSSPRLYERLKTDIYRWHSYTELFLEGRWVKATPAFNRTLCERLGVHPLEFDGRSDSLFQEYDPTWSPTYGISAGSRHLRRCAIRHHRPRIPRLTIPTSCRAASPVTFKQRRSLAIWNAVRTPSTPIVPMQGC